MNEEDHGEQADDKGAHTVSIEELQRENALLKEKVFKLEQLASRDTLTPLFNRRHFHEVLERWSWRAHRYGGDYGVIFIDVDELKAVNDGMGHAIGDKVLMAIADILQKNIRRSDVAARLGGDEFGILLDNVKGEAIAVKAEKLREAVSALQLKVDGNLVNPTISLGYGSVEPGKSAEEIMSKVDGRMYREKNSNRRVIGPGD